MAQEIHGLGTLFKRWLPSASIGGGAWEDVCNITSISGPGNTKDTLETTDLCTIDGFRTFISGLKDAGEISLAMNYGQTVWQKLYADYEGVLNGNYAIVLPDGLTLEFEGLVTACPLEIPMDEKVTSEVTIKISGKPTIDLLLSPIP